MGREVELVAVQFPVTFDVAANVGHVQEALRAAPAHSIIVTPEGSVSGYATTADELREVDWAGTAEAITALEAESAAARVALWVGCYQREGDLLFNAAICLGGRPYRYDKANLATAERSFVTAGNDLSPFQCGSVTVGVQLCREVRFPDQWRKLAQRGAQIFAHLNNAVADSPSEPSAWREMLVARAAELQRYVISVNVAAVAQRAPTLVVAPSGAVLAELPRGETVCMSVSVDLEQTSNWYLDEYRDEL